MKRNHIVLISGWWSSWFGRYRKWARTLEARFKAHYGSRVGRDVIIHEVSSDGQGEKVAIDAVMADHQAGTLGTVVVAGHSNGGGELDIFSQLCYAVKITIAYAATIDRTLGYRSAMIFGSVQHFDEFWAGLRKTRFHESFKGKKFFFDLDKMMKRNVSHVEAASLTIVQDKIFSEVTQRIK